MRPIRPARRLGPWLQGCLGEGIDFRGIIYPGVMLTKTGPKVLEFNARFGDPEAQVYLTRLENDLLELLEASVDGTLDRVELKWNPMASVCVVMASGGYPGPYATNKPISARADNARYPASLRMCLAKRSRPRACHSSSA